MREHKLCNGKDCLKNKLKMFLFPVPVRIRILYKEL